MRYKPLRPSVGGLGWTAAGIAAGALTYHGLDGVIERRVSGGGTALALAAFLDGVPEQLVLGIGIAGDAGVGLGLLVAIFISNVSQTTGSASQMLGGGASRRSILMLWLGGAVLCAAATVVGWATASSASEAVRAGIDGFAAGALIVMLIDSMIPAARQSAGRPAGLVATLGFAVALALSSLS